MLRRPRGEVRAVLTFSDLKPYDVFCIDGGSGAKLMLLPSGKATNVETGYCIGKLLPDLVVMRVGKLSIEKLAG